MVDAPSSALPTSSPLPPIPTAPDATELLRRAMLGPLHTDHYLNAFARFDASPRARLGWNWAACLCTLNWMLLRRLWVEALLYAAAVTIAALLVLGLARLVLDASATVQLCLAVALATIAFGVPGALGNTWLYRAFQRRCAATLQAAPTLDAACARLARMAPTRHRVIGLAVANALVAALGVTVWMAAGQPPQATQHVPPPQAPREAASVPAPSAPASATTPPSPAASVVSAVPAPVSDLPVPPALLASSPAPPPAASEDFGSQDAAMARYVSRAPAPTPTPVPAPAAKAATPRSAQRAKPASAPDSGTRYRINIAVFADADNARRAIDKLQAADITADTSDVETPRGTRTRLRAGPYETRAEADAAAARIRALRLEAVVIPVR